MTKIDYDKIIDAIETNGELLTTDLVIDCMKQSIREALPIILEYVAGQYIDDESELYTDIQQQAILSNKDELIKLLEL